MSERRKRSRASGKTIAYIAAGLVHLIIIGTMVFNFTSDTETVVAQDSEIIAETIQATTVSESDIQKQQDKIKQKDLDKERETEREEDRLEDLKKKSEQEEQRIEDLEQERKAIDLKKKKEKEQELKKDLAEKKAKEKKAKEKKAQEKKDKKEKERKKKIADDKKKVEDAARVAREQQRLDAEERLRQELISEQNGRIAAQRTTTLIGRFSARIRDAINAKRIIAPDFTSGLKTKLNIKLSPRGDVTAVSIVESSGSQRYDRSAETAVRQASPLPIPASSESERAHATFRDFDLNITMPGAN